VSGTLGIYRIDACVLSALSVRLGSLELRGYCPDGLDLWRERQGQSQRILSAVTLDETRVVAIDTQPNDVYFATLPNDSTAINGIRASLVSTPIPSTGWLANLLLLFVLGYAAWATRRRG
jgi:hypothetical protein